MQRVVVYFLVLFAFFVSAQEIKKADNSDALNTAGAWVGGSVPGASNVAVWDSAVTGANTVDLGGAMTWDGLRLANPGGEVTINGTATLTLDGGAATDINLTAATQDLTFNVPISLPGTQKISIGAGRTLTFEKQATFNSSATIDGSGAVVCNGNVTSSGSTFSQKGGHVTLRGTTTVSTGAAETFGIYNGTMVLDGGALNLSHASGRFFVGRSDATSDGILIVSNGTHTIGTTNNDNMANFVGVSSAKRGQLFMEGGSLTVNYLRLATNAKGGQVNDAPDQIVVNGGLLSVLGALSKGFMMATPHQETHTGSSGRQGTLTINGGRFEVPNGITQIAPDVNGGTYSGGAEIFLNGGVWALKYLKFGNSGNVSRALTFDGGTLEGVNVARNGELVENPPPFKVRAGGAWLSAPDGERFCVTANFEEATESPGGGVVKIGGGRIKLGGIHTYSGWTIVSNGVLAIAGTIPQARLAVAPGAMLSLADGALTLLDPKALRMGMGGVPSGLELEVLDGGNQCDRLVIPADAWLQHVAVHLLKVGTEMPLSREVDLHICSYSGTPPLLSSFSWGNPVPGLACSFALDENLQMVVMKLRKDETAVESVWLAPNGGAWSVAQNWSRAPLAASGARVTFGSVLEAASSVALTTPFTLGGITFDSSLAYTLDGTGALTFDNGGVPAEIAVNSGSHTIDLPITLASQLDVDVPTIPQSLTLNAPLTGSGGVVKRGEGELKIAADNTHAGGFTLLGGSIAVYQPGTTFGSGPIVLNAPFSNTGGRIRNVSASVLAIPNDVIVATSTAVIDTYNAPIHLSGNLQFRAYELQKGGTDELIIAGTTEDSANRRLNLRNGTIRFVDGSRYVVTYPARDALYIADSASASSSRYIIVEEGAYVQVGGINTGSAMSNIIHIKGGVLALTGDSVEVGLLRSATTSPVGTDRIIVDGGRFEIAPNKWLSLGVRNGNGELIVNGGEALVSYLSLGVRVDGSFTSASYLAGANVEVNGGRLVVGGVLNWMGDLAVNRVNKFTLNGGILRLPPTVRSAQVANQSIFTLNGGVLEVGDPTGYPNATYANYLAGLNQLYIDQGGAIIDTRGYDVVITQAVQSVSQGLGDLVKRGAGSLTFVDAYNVATGVSIEEGALCLASANAITTIEAAAGTTFSLHGNTFDALALTSVKLGDDVTLELDVSPSSTACDTLALPSDAQIGRLVIALRNVGAESFADTANLAWPILSYSGNAPDVSGWQLAERNFSAFQFTTNTVAQTIEVTLLESDLFATWANEGGAEWSEEENWTPWAPAASGALTRFGNAISASAIVNVDAPVAVAGMHFEHTQSYTIAGASITLDGGVEPAKLNVWQGTHALTTPLSAASDVMAWIEQGATLRLGGQISGSGLLTARGNGTLALDGTNTLAALYQDGVKLWIAEPASLGTAAVTLADVALYSEAGGEVANDITLIGAGADFSAATGCAVTMAGAISGDGNFVKTGSGLYDLGDNALYGGATILRGGTLKLNMLPEGALELGYGTLAFTGTGATSQEVTIDSQAGAAILSVENSLTLSGPITTLSGAFCKSGAGELIISGANNNLLGVRNSSSQDQAALFDDDGVISDSGFASFSVAQGRVTLGAAGQTNYIGSRMFVGFHSTTNAGAETAGEVVVVGGVTEIADYLTIGRNNGSSLTAPQGLTSRVIVRDGDFVARRLSMAANTSLGDAIITARPELLVQGGVCRVLEQFNVGMGVGSVCMVHVSGGELYHDAPTTSARLGSNGGTAILRVSGGTATFANDVIAGYGGANCTGIVELVGGELIAKRLYSYNQDSTSRLLFDGGVFKATGSGLDNSIDELLIGENPAIFDTSLLDGIGDFVLSGTLTGADVVDGGIIKQGGGVMRIAAPQAYSGPTIVSNGVLSIDSADALPESTHLTVAPGAALVFSSTPVFTAKVAGLTLGYPAAETPAALTIRVVATNYLNDAIEVAGDVAVHSLALTCMWGYSTESALPNGRYELLRWSGSGPTDTTAFTIANPLAGKDYLLSIEDKTVVLTVGPGLSNLDAFIWKATDGGSWSDATKWSTSPESGGIGAMVRFDQTINAPATVTLNQDATLGQLYLNSEEGYTLAGTHTMTIDNGAEPAMIHLERGEQIIATPLTLMGETVAKTFSTASLWLNGTISGAGAITKSGAGTLTLAGLGNDFTGGVTIASASGRVALTNGATAGSGLVAFSAGGTLATLGQQAVALAGGLAVRTGESVTLEVGAQAPLQTDRLEMQNNQKLIKRGAGELVLSGACEVAGDTASLLTIEQGILRFAAGANWRIGRNAREIVFMNENLPHAKGVSVDAGAYVAASCIYSGYGTNTLFTVNGQLDLTAVPDALLLRVRDANAVDRFVVNVGGVVTTAPGSYVHIGVRGPAEFLVDGGTALLRGVALGYKTPDVVYGGDYGRVRVANHGFLQVAERWLWMGDSNNLTRANLLVVDSGGTAALPNTIANQPTGFSALLLDDGTLQIAGQGVEVYDASNYLAGLKSLVVGREGATIDTAGKSATIAQRVGYDSVTCLSKTGAGVLELTYPLAWPGLVRVEDGMLCASLTSGVAYSELPAGLLVRYSGESTPGVDTSGNGRHGKPWGGNVTTVADATGGSAHHFSGNASVLMPLDEELIGRDTYTVCVWIKMASVSGGGTATTFFSTRIDYGSIYQFMLRIYNGRLRYMSTGGTVDSWASNTFDSTETIPANIWVHTAAAVTPSGLKLYINGRAAGTFTKSHLKFSAPTKVPGDLGYCIGSYYATKSPPSDSFSGDIDDVQVYGRDLSDAEIAALAEVPTKRAPTLQVAKNASIALATPAEVTTLQGEGYVTGSALTVLESIKVGDDADAAVDARLFADDLILADGASYQWRWNPLAGNTLHVGHLTIAGSGTVDLGREEGNLISGSFRAVLAEYDTITGAPNLATWCVINAGGRGYEAVVLAENGEVCLDYHSRRGTIILLR